MSFKEKRPPPDPQSPREGRSISPDPDHAGRLERCRNNYRGATGATSTWREQPKHLKPCSPASREPLSSTPARAQPIDCNVAPLQSPAYYRRDRGPLRPKRGSQHQRLQGLLRSRTRTMAGKKRLSESMGEQGQKNRTSDAARAWDNRAPTVLLKVGRADQACAAKALVRVLKPRTCSFDLAKKATPLRGRFGAPVIRCFPWGLAMLKRRGWRYSYSYWSPLSA
jgi:hypothetical protein